MSTEAAGRELTYTSVLGPLLAVSVFAEEDPAVAEKFFSGKESQNAVRAVAQQLQQDMEFVRVALHKLVHSILVNSVTREAALKYLGEVSCIEVRRAPEWLLTPLSVFGYRSWFATPSGSRCTWTSGSWPATAS